MKKKNFVNQPGRPIKRPKLEPGEIIMPERLFMPGVKKILKSCGAPSSWDENIADFLLHCAWMPDAYIGPVPTERRPFRGLEQLSDLMQQLRPIHCAQFCVLYCEAPDVFLRCMTKIRAHVKRCLKSSRFQVAAEIGLRANEESLWQTNVHEIELGMKEFLGKDAGVTATTVEKAREMLNKLTDNFPRNSK